MSNTRIVKIFSLFIFLALLTALISPLGSSRRIVVAAIILPASILASIFIKKRNTLSINKRQILLIMTVSAAVFVTLYYLSGLKFGFYLNLYSISPTNFLKFFLPIAVIVFASELLRYVMMAQPGRLPKILCYFSCVFAEILIVSTIPEISSFNRFISVVTDAFFPAILSNLLYCYLSRRYGLYPNLAYRGITVLHTYIFSVTSAIPTSLHTFLKLLIPILLFMFIDALYERKVRRALKNTPRILRYILRALAVILLIMMLGVVMLVSNRFTYGSLVIATESMTGAIDKGDVIIFEKYDGIPPTVGQVIVFNKDDTNVVHRVVDIKIIDGVTQYYTKGDANDDNDAGFITDADIVGVVRYKLSNLGHPTIWMRSLFSR